MGDTSKLIDKWVSKAENDLDCARTMFKSGSQYSDVVCFHSQQCAEKLIKARLLKYDVEPPRSHDLIYLLKLLSKHELISDELMLNANIINEYAVEIRYPGDVYEPTAKDAEEALNASEYMYKILALDLR